MEDSEHFNNPHNDIDILSKIDLYEAIDNLRDEYKTVIILRYMQDMQIKHIAKIIGCKENTVKSYIHRALKSLRVTLGEE